jgi:hypothetical protein
MSIHNSDKLNTEHLSSFLFERDEEYSGVFF